MELLLDKGAALVALLMAVGEERDSEEEEAGEAGELKTTWHDLKCAVNSSPEANALRNYLKKLTTKR